MSTSLSTLLSSHISVVLLLLILISFAALAFLAQLKEDEFDVRDLLRDSKTGKLSLNSVSQFIALVVSTWGFVYVTLNDRLSDWFFWGYMAVWTSAAVAEKFINKSKDSTSKKEDD